MLVAAGFHRLGPLRKNAGNQDAAYNRNEVLVEMTNVIGSGCSASRSAARAATITSSIRSGRGTTTASRRSSPRPISEGRSALHAGAAGGVEERRPPPSKRELKPLRAKLKNAPERTAPSWR